MAARSAWTGAITLGGFPINVTAYSLLKSKSAESFKGLCPCHHQPVKMPRVCSVDGTPVTDPIKGVVRGSGKSATYIPVPADAVAALASAERSVALEILQLPKADEIPWHMATGRYGLVPDPKVPGSEGPVGILWNGLLASGRCVIMEWTKRAGSRPSLAAVRADEDGLTAVDLPYFTDLKVEKPGYEFVVNEQAQQMFETFVTTMDYDVGKFDLATFVDTYAERRAELVEKALNGEVIEASAAPAPVSSTPDLMAMMTAALAGKGKPKATAKDKVVA